MYIFPHVFPSFRLSSSPLLKLQLKPLTIPPFPGPTQPCSAFPLLPPPFPFHCLPLHLSTICFHFGVIDDQETLLRASLLTSLERGCQEHHTPSLYRISPSLGFTRLSKSSSPPTLSSFFPIIASFQVTIYFVLPSHQTLPASY